TAVAPKVAGLRLVRQVDLEDLLEAAEQLRVRNGKNNLLAVAQIATHQIGAAQVDLLGASVAKVIDPAVFKKSPHDAGYADVLTPSRYSRPQTAESTHQQVHPNSGL